jgi:polyhydroxyalkanoate synthesis regulator phasin
MTEKFERPSYVSKSQEIDTNAIKQQINNIEDELGELRAKEESPEVKARINAKERQVTELRDKLEGKEI